VRQAVDDVDDAEGLERRLRLRVHERLRADGVLS